MKILVNGNAVGEGLPGTYFPLDRAWSHGDTIDFSLPAAVRVKRYQGADQIPGKERYAFEYGPILLAAVGLPKTDAAIQAEGGPEALAGLLEAMDGSPLHFSVRGNPGLKFMPYWQITDEEFTCYPAVPAQQQLGRNAG